MKTPLQNRVARWSAGLGHLLPAVLYLSLAAFPGWWDAEARARMYFQFFFVELGAGMLVGAVGRLVVERSAQIAMVGAAVVMCACVGGLIAVGWTTGSLSMVGLVGAPLLPRVIAAVRLVRSGPMFGGMLVRESFITIAGCVLVAFAYLALMSSSPKDPAGTASVSPPTAVIASAMAVYYLILGWYAGNPRGSEHWGRFGRASRRSWIARGKRQRS